MGCPAIPIDLRMAKYMGEIMILYQAWGVRHFQRNTYWKHHATTVYFDMHETVLCIMDIDMAKILARMMFLISDIGRGLFSKVRSGCWE